ncbi:MAG: GntR family transcriptional regulator [Coriobacteriales bacterium]|jgi:DNA-binding transcriptional regulator YhcF (GntR family)|nr:GntR family transcriptional regulator [Coriobacteriales bacterium]
MEWAFADDRPIYAQIVEQIEMGILSGECPAGSALPSVRALALEAEVNPNTVQRAFLELESLGLVRTHRTSGRTVTEDGELVMAVRRRTAQGRVERFLADMRSLGFDAAQAVSLLAEAAGQQGCSVLGSEPKDVR